MGYSSDGISCIPCPLGSTCDDVGILSCRGQCAFGKLSHCDPLTGYVTCLDYPNCSAYTLPARFQVSRANYIQPASCAPAYPACQTGYYLAFLSTGAVDCLSCNVTYAFGGKFVSQVT